MRIKEIKLKTLEAYRDTCQCLSFDPKDKFVSGIEVAYKLTLVRLGYKEDDLLNQKFIHNEIERLRKQG